MTRAGRRPRAAPPLPRNRRTPACRGDAATPPTFAELNRPDATGLPLAWGVWGEADEVGTLNNIAPGTTAAAAGLVRRGVRFNLNLPLHTPLGEIGPAAHALRKAPVPTLFKRKVSGLEVRDDKIDDLYLQASTQWDGLSHIGDPLHGFYNGVQDAQITQGEGTRLGIEHYVRLGIATRGVLVDLPRFYGARGDNWSPMGSQVAPARDVASAITAAGLRLRPGDVLLVRTGWVTAFRDAPDPETRDRLFRGRDYSGLSGGTDMWEFLWDSGVAAVASDSVTVEAWPLREGAPSLHLAIARLGLVLGRDVRPRRARRGLRRDRGVRVLLRLRPAQPARRRGLTGKRAGDQIALASASGSAGLRSNGRPESRAEPRLAAASRSSTLRRIRSQFQRKVGPDTTREATTVSPSFTGAASPASPAIHASSAIAQPRSRMRRICSCMRCSAAASRLSLRI